MNVSKEGGNEDTTCFFTGVHSNLLIECSMKNRCFLIVLFLCVTFSVEAQQTKPLAFNESGELKIVQFTDVHFQVGNPASESALECIDHILEVEQPHLVIFTGDIVYNKPAEEGLRTVLQRVSNYKVPFVVTLGNHDEEQDLDRTMLYNVVRSIPGCLQTEECNQFVLRVNSSQGINTAALLYVFDSHAYSPLPHVKGYDWIKENQIAWYRQVSAQFTNDNQQSPLPALSFFHIPLPEYGEAASDQNAIMYGTRMEAACSPKLNSGLFTAFMEQGDVMGCFVGHDHDNDYAVMWRGILLAYGRFTGGNTEYNHLPNGARVIVLHEGQRCFTTWIRTRDGIVEQRTNYPDSYIKDDWRKRK